MQSANPVTGPSSCRGGAGREIVSLTLEKQEVSNLAISVLQLLEELEEKYPDLPPAAHHDRALRSETPFEPNFRVSQLIIGYDEEDDMIWLIAKAMVADESGAIVDPEDERVPAARFVAIAVTDARAQRVCPGGRRPRPPQLPALRPSH